MIRTLRRYIATDGNDNKEYIYIACLSTDTKPTTGIITGSAAIEVDTGKRYEFNEVAGEWVEQPASGGGGSGLPPVTSEDNGKVLGVEDGEWGPVEAPSGLPDVTASDNGEVLTVENGAWTVGDAPSEFFTVTVSNSYFGAITADRTYSEINAAFSAGTPILMVYKATMALTTSAVALMYRTSWVESYVSVTAFVGDISDTQCVAITATGITLRNRSALPTVSASDNGKVLQVVNGAWAASSGVTEKLTVLNDGSWRVSGEPSSGFIGDIGVAVQIQNGYQITSQAVILGSGYASYTAIDAIALYVDMFDSNKVKWLLIHVDKNDATQNTFTETDYAT